ncbi:MAG: ExbD/TolR family protein [Pseudomonadota bacterium]
MGMSTGVAQSGGSKRRRNKRHQPINEINVTPFVDVMLVLLIIFMVAAPLLTVGVEVDLPETAAAPVNVETKPLELSITKDGKIFLGGNSENAESATEIPLNELTPKLRAVTDATQEKFDTRIFIKGDSAAPYEIIAKVLGQISAAGYKKFTMTSLPQQ